MAAQPHYDAQGLGRAIRERRMELRMTQEAVGKSAGYASGAGVTMSRIEGGVMHPSFERLESLAAALDTTVEDLTRAAALHTQAAGDQQRSSEQDSSEQGPGRQGSKRSGGGRDKEGQDGRTGKEEGGMRARIQKLQKELNERTTTITRLGTAFNDHHDAARDTFFLPFIELARSIEGVPSIPVPPAPDENGAADPGSAAGAYYRVRLTRFGITKAIGGTAGGLAAGAGAGAAGAFATFSIAASIGTASTGTAIAGLSGIAATNATLAALGGGALAAGGMGIAGGIALLTGIVALPATGLAIVAGALMLRRRNKAIEAQLTVAEQQTAQTRPGYEALTTMLRESAAILETIEVHGARALNKWMETLAGFGTGFDADARSGPTTTPMRWNQLSDPQRRRYEDFTTVAACHLSVLGIDPTVFMASPDQAALREQIALSSATLATARTTIDQLV